MGKRGGGQLDLIKSDGRFIVCFGPKWSARKNLKNQAGVLSLFYRVFVRVGRLIESRLISGFAKGNFVPDMGRFWSPGSNDWPVKQGCG
jgi:hypothetical protein